MEFALWLGLITGSIVIHELSHGVVAYLLGDDTAKRSGRLSLNPFRHVDPVWTILFPVILYFSSAGRFVFAMAKPVPVDFSRLHQPKKDMVLVALAGPLSNLLLASLMGFLWRATGFDFFLMGAYLNLGLAVFNMVPIPPLDGSRVLAGFFPASIAMPYLRIERIGYLALFVLYFTGLLMIAMRPVIDALCHLMNIPVLTFF